MFVSIPRGPESVDIPSRLEEHTTNTKDGLFLRPKSVQVEGNTIYIEVEIPETETVVTLAEATASNAYFTIVSASLDLIFRAAVHGMYPTFTPINGVLFTSRYGHVKAHVAGVLDVIPQEHIKSIQTELQGILRKDTIVHLQQSQHMNPSEDPVREASIIEVLKRVAVVFSTHGLKYDELVHMFTKLESLQSGGEPVSTHHQQNDPIPSTKPRSNSNRTEKESRFSIPMEKVNSKKTNTQRVHDTPQGGLAPLRQGQQQQTHQPEKNIILKQIGNMLLNHGNHKTNIVRWEGRRTNTIPSWMRHVYGEKRARRILNRFDDDDDRENNTVPSWMRHVYGEKRARRILNRLDDDDGDGDGHKKKKGIKFRTISFVPTKSWIPRKH